MATYQKFHSLVAALANKVHNLGSDTLKVMLTNVAPVATNTQKSNLTEIAAGNGYTAGGIAVTGVTSTQTSGLYKLVGNDVTFTASGGSMATFRYAVLYNDTAANDELIGFWDYGTGITLSNGESCLVDFNGTDGVFQLT